MNYENELCILLVFLTYVYHDAWLEHVKYIRQLP
jgi:hypothetical protein